MIHEFIQLIRPFIVFDTETTGVDRKKDRIVQLAFELYEADGLKKQWKSLVNPEMSIPVEATKAHGITDEIIAIGCRRCHLTAIEHPHDTCQDWAPIPTFAQIAKPIAKGFSSCDFGGKNIRHFDLPLLANEMKRVGVDWSYTGAMVIDIERLEQIGEPRTLSHLYEKHVGKPLADAHDAMIDVRASAEILRLQLTTYRDVLPRDLGKLHEMQWPGYIDVGGSFRFDGDGVPRCQFGKHRGTDMRKIPRDYYDWMLSKGDFDADVRALAADAKLGKFPAKK